MKVNEFLYELTFPANMARGLDGELEYSIEDGQRPSTAVIHAVSIATDTDPVELPSLYDTVNPKRLDLLFSDQRAGSVSFEWYDCLVTIERGERIVVSTDA